MQPYGYIDWLCCTLFVYVRTRISSCRGTCARAYATWLGSVHLPGDARRMHVRRSRHLLFYNPKVEGRQVTRAEGYGVHLIAKPYGLRNPRFRIRGFCYMRAYISHALSVL
ncbi:hypothetical protein CRG98_038979 [Punica granatum]|uniref:Uncharacterized protein n=1 Tax=Punica granatum TaxID=22663 RepID=A0A2I0IAD4_PUNGR|nr:hypothetical protein CRG98_038979 [Punica granatum]